MTLPTLLLATDLLPKTEPAIARVARLAGTLRAQTTLMHAIAPGPINPKAPDEQQCLARLDTTVAHYGWSSRNPASTRVRRGVPASAIIEVAAELRPHLLVLGPHARKSGSERIKLAFGGTVVERALAARICPVLVVREQPSHAYQRILVALDLSTTGIRAIRAAESLVVSPQADLSVLHADNAPYMGSVEHLSGARGMSSRYFESWRSRVTVSVRALLRQASSDLSRYGIQIEDQPPARAILHAMARQEPDLLVLGTSGRGPFGRALIGSVANEVLSEAWCDVLVVPDLARLHTKLADSDPMQRIERRSIDKTRYRWL